LATKESGMIELAIHGKEGGVIELSVHGGDGGK